MSYLDRSPDSGAARRRYPRLDVDARVHTHDVTLALDVEMRDVSFGGFQLVSSVPFVPGDVHVFRVETPDGRICTLRARVMHCRSSEEEGEQFRIGCQGTGDSATAEGLTAVIDSLTSELLFEN